MAKGNAKRTAWKKLLGRKGPLLLPAAHDAPTARLIERALDDLKAGRPMPPDQGVDLDQYEEIVGLPEWSAIEKRFETH